MSVRRGSQTFAVIVYGAKITINQYKYYILLVIFRQGKVNIYQNAFSVLKHVKYSHKYF